MRPRIFVLILALVALPVAIALLVGRSHPRKPAATGARPTLVGLNLKGGISDLQAAACGSAHHYTAYRAGERIDFGGTINSPPKGNWKVKVKLKSCIGEAFQDSGSAPARVRHDNSFKGSFRAPVPGYYFARASVNVGGRRIARSAKQFFQIR